MTTNHHTPHTGVVIINDTGDNFNAPLAQLDQAITNWQAGLLPPTRLQIGTESVDASAVVQMASTTKAWQLPVLTTAQRDAIATPAPGLLIWNSTDSAINVYNGSSWANFSNSGILASNTFSAAASTTLSNIPQTYDHLQLRLTIAPDSLDSGQVLTLRFNADSTSDNYSYSYSYNDTNAHLFTASGIVFRYMNEKTSNAANVRCEYIIDILDYKDTSLPKGVFIKGCFVASGAETPLIVRGSGSWHKAGFEAITSLTFLGAVNTSGAYSLYGV